MPYQKNLEDHAMSRASGAARFALAHAFLDSWFEDQRIARPETATQAEALPFCDTQSAPATAWIPQVSSEEDSDTSVNTSEETVSLDARSSTRTFVSSTKLKASVRSFSSWAIASISRRRA